MGERPISFPCGAAVPPAQSPLEIWPPESKLYALIPAHPDLEFH